MNLPEAHESHKQEFKSIIALIQALEDFNFIIRHTERDDYGVDITIEPKVVLQNGKKYPSNCLCQIQIKSKKDSTKIITRNNKYSYPIKVKTLNYLSKHPGSIFMIYLENEKSFVWDWVYKIEDYVVKNSNSNLDNIKKETVNYQFYQRLDQDAINEIYKVTLEIGEKLTKLKSIIINNSLENVNIQEKILTKIKKHEEELEKLINDKDYRKAFDKYSHIAELLEEEESYLFAAMLGIMASKYKEASYYCNNVVKLNHSNYLAYFLNGISYVRRGKIKKAEKAFLESIHLNITIESLVELGRLMVEENRIGEAIDYFANAYFIDNKNKYVNLSLGCLYYGISKFSASLFHLTKLIDENADDDFVYALIASNYLDVGENELAEKYFTKAYQVKNNTSYLIGLSVSLYLNNKKKEANDLINKWKLSSEFDHSTKKIAFIYAGWKRDIFIQLTEENYIGKVDIVNNDERCGLDYIFMTVSKDKSGIYIPVVGKVYNRFDDYDKTLNETKKRTNFIEDAFLNHQSIEFDNKTELYLREEKEKVFIRINISGYVIEGYTDVGRKRFLPEFIKAYKKIKCFQVEFHEIEKNNYVFYVIKGNLTYELLNK